MAMESLLLQASGVAAGFPVSSSTSGTNRRHGRQQGFCVAAQRFMRGVDLGASGCARRERRFSRSGSVVVVAARRSAAQEQQEVAAPEYTESIAEPHGHESSFVGSPLLWIGVGVGLSALFSFGANQVKRYAMQQMLKSMTGGAGGTSPFGGPGGASPFGGPGSNPFAGMPMPPPGSQLPFSMPPPSATSTPPVSAAAAAPPVDVAPTSVTSSQPSEQSTTTAEPRKSGKQSTSCELEFRSSSVCTCTNRGKLHARRIAPPRPRQQSGAHALEVVTAIVPHQGEEDDEDGVEDAALPPIQHVQPRRHVVHKNPLVHLLSHARAPAPRRAVPRLLLISVIRHRCWAPPPLFKFSCRNAKPPASLTGLDDAPVVVIARR